MDGCPINVYVSLAALFVVKCAFITDARQDQSISYARRSVLVASEPGDGPDGSGNKKEAVGKAKIPARKKFGKMGRDCESGQIVVGERRMAGVARNQNFFRRPAGQIAFAVAQVAALQCGVDAHFVAAVLEGQQLIVRQAEAPIFLVVGGTVRNPVRAVRDRE